MTTRTALLALSALAACVAGCHPALEPEIGGSSCSPGLPYEEGEQVVAGAQLGELVDGVFVPLGEGAEVEAAPNPSGAEDALWVVGLRVGIPASQPQPSGRRPSKSCSWARTDRGPQGVLIWQGLASNAVVTEPLLFGVGRDLARLDGQTEVQVEAWLWPYHATARVRPVNREGYLSGD